MSHYTKIVADVAPEVKQKLIDLKKAGESNKDVLVRLIEQEHSKKVKK